MDALDDDFAAELPLIAAGWDIAAAQAQEREAPKAPGKRPLYGDPRGMNG